MIKTPLQYIERLSKKYGANIFFKREDLQPIRSFKIRGVQYKLEKEMLYEKPCHLITASAGNHAQGVAYMSNKYDIPCTIFVPENTPEQKIDKIQYFGKDKCDIKKVGMTFDDALSHSIRYNEGMGAMFIHPFDDPMIVKGQGSIIRELGMVPDIITCSVGGGGLMSGLIGEVCDNTNVIGVETWGASAMSTSLKYKNRMKLREVDTFADGISVQLVGEYTFKKCLEYHKTSPYPIYVESINKLCHTMVELYQYEGVVTEPAGALSVSCLDRISDIKNKDVVCIISGGNNDISRYPEIIERSLVYQDKLHYFKIMFMQQPGELKNFILNIMGVYDDITHFEYIKKSNQEYGEVLLGITTPEIDNFTNKMQQHQIQFKKTNRL